jgi:xylulokinase
VVPEPAEYVALGAARQAAWTLSGEGSAPRWRREHTVLDPGDETADHYRRVRSSYAAVLARAGGLLTG